MWLRWEPLPKGSCCYPAVTSHVYGCVSQSCRSAKKSQHKNKSTCWANQNSLLCAAGQKLWVSGFQDDSGDPGALQAGTARGWMWTWVPRESPMGCFSGVWLMEQRVCPRVHGDLRVTLHQTVPQLEGGCSLKPLVPSLQVFRRDAKSGIPLASIVSPWATPAHGRSRTSSLPPRSHWECYLPNLK